MLAGVVMGLAWTALGGSTLYVEAASVEKGEGKGRLNATGRLHYCAKDFSWLVYRFRGKGWARAGSIPKAGGPWRDYS